MGLHELQEGFQATLSKLRNEFEEGVKDSCATAKSFLRTMIGFAQADLGTLAEHLRLAEKHEQLLSAPPDENELHRLEDQWVDARDVHADDLEKERRLERQHQTEQRRAPGAPGNFAALQEAQAATIASRKAVQRAEQAFHRKLIDLVCVKQAPWGLPELKLKVDDEHLDAVDVLTPGRRCGDYEELLPLAGGNNAVFTAVYNDEPCVLKEMRSMAQSGALKREVLNRKKLKHPLIVPVLAAFEEEDKGRSIAYVHMPRYSCNLEEWCKRCISDACTFHKLRQVLRDVVLVVAYVHSQSVVHGDLKPSNFLMDSEDRPCLTDFETSQCTDSRSTNSRRTTMVVGGTHGFMPPEFPDVTAASDIYSLGCICDFLLECWLEKWPQTSAEQHKAIAEVVAKMQSQTPSSRPNAVEVLDHMTTALKTETVEMPSPLYWRNTPTLKCEVTNKDLAEWQHGLTTFQQLEAALQQTLHDSCCLSHLFAFSYLG